MSKAGGWLRGSSKRGATSSTLTSRPSAGGVPQSLVQSTSSTVYGGGVKDATGKTAEFSVCCRIVLIYVPRLSVYTVSLVYG